MLKIFFKTTFCRFNRSRGLFLINIIGLSVGIACALLIYLWVNSELHVDTFNKKEGRLMQVMKNYSDVNGVQTGEDTPGLLAGALQRELPEVERSVAVFPPADYTFKGILSQDQVSVKARSKYAGKDFFNVFSYPLIHGDKNQVLADQSSAVISVDLARNLFHSADNVVGKTVEWEGERIKGTFLITGVFKSPPPDATIQFDIVINYGFLLDQFPQFSKWSSSGPSTYVILEKQTDREEFDHKIKGFVKSKYAESPITLFTRPYSDRYLYNDYKNGALVGGRIEYVKLFSIIAIFILLIACINFMNLSTAKASYRFKEIGVRKALGANRKTLILQYLSESQLMAFISLLLAVLYVELFLPEFNHITGKQLTLPFTMNFIFPVLGITLFTGFIAGSYPAIYLSGFKPVSVLKGTVTPGKGQNPKGELRARKGLVVFQFMISVILIISVLVVYRQMQFIQSKNLGLEKDHVIHFTAEGKLAGDPQTFLSEIKAMPGIVDASYMHGDLTGLHGGTSAINWEGKEPDQSVEFQLLGVGYDLVETLGIKVKEGRDFSRDYHSEDSKIIFNEAAVKSMGLKNPIGKTVTLWGQKKQIIGVVKNFHYESLYENIKPFFFQLVPGGENMLVKIKAGTEKKTIQKLAEFYQNYTNALSFDYTFLNDDYQALYAAEQRVLALSRYFAGFTVLISCLGLFGLSAFTVERRQKEIGLRKVLGASVTGLATYLSWDFIKLVLIAALIAGPAAWYIASRWLQNFAYRIEIDPQIFLLAGGLVFLVTLLTISWQTVRAALTNPVDSLRSE